MTEPIRVLHFADTHVGMENYGKTDPATGLSSRVVDFLHRMDAICDYARQNEADLIIFAGDAFKTRAPNPTYQREFAHRIRDLSEIAPTILLVGNHDLPPTMLKASSIEIYDTLRVPNVYVAADYDLGVIETRRGPVALGTAPYPIRSRLLEDERSAGLTIAETDLLLQDRLSAILDQLAERADAHDMPRLMAGHFTVSGAVVGSERSIMLGRDVAVPLSALADPRWDYVALGHIHKHQNLTSGQRGVPPVIYSGSIERIDFGEEGDPKGFCWVELARNETRWQFVELPGVRPFVTLRADLRNAPNPTDNVVKLIARHDLREAVVRLILDLSPETESRFNENIVRDELKHAGVFQIAGIRKQVEQPARARLGANPEGLTPLELLERYLISKEVAEDRRLELLDAALPILQRDTYQDTAQ
ncbi:MAG: exonuclease SbcCD subunit D [Anaerolineae bacterium]|nr:exonuclease SbcCD subunit D [Anaerolineae bacterium]